MWDARVPREVHIEPEQVAGALTRALIEAKGDDIALLDMRKLVDYTDVFVLVTARNRRHVSALAEDVKQHAKRVLEIPCNGIEGLAAARWVLVDFGGVIVHIFDQDMRGFYNLDGLWSDAPRMDTSLGDASEAPPPQP